MAAECYYRAKGQHPLVRWAVCRTPQLGPVESAELRRLADTGTVTPDALVRKGADGRWVRADKVQGLFQRSDSPPTVAVRHVEGEPEADQSYKVQLDPEVYDARENVRPHNSHQPLHWRSDEGYRQVLYALTCYATAAPWRFFCAAAG